MYQENKNNIKYPIKIASLFSGCGGLDLGFEKAGFDIMWANEFDSTIWETFEHNFPHTKLDKRSILDIHSLDLPQGLHGIIGGPPCQSWSEAGANRGINDDRGKVFFEYIRILRDLKPLFFLAENVSGILSEMHKQAFDSIISGFSSIGYNVTFELLNAKHYNVPQDRERVIIVGYNKIMQKNFTFPTGSNSLITLKDAIKDLPEPVPAQQFNKTNGLSLKIKNHEYMNGGFSSIYMSRNRVRGWDEQSFTIQAGGRHAPIHPKAPRMKFIEQNKRVFVPGKEHLYRRLSVRECARIQTFPDNFTFYYKDISDGYKMVGNAVPVEFAKAIANKIMIDIQEYIIGINQYTKSFTQPAITFRASSPLTKYFQEIQKKLKKKYKKYSKIAKTKSLKQKKTKKRAKIYAKSN
ncbi:MAG: DNA (cytosine-5-)-methyltransferase [Elusimicrobia bacterium RIFOXYB2_FULL_48_7]|nr:MAG: DNA (cytosine-5-)-methyltransferase [Elusimicrobia bacterium RIFOXYB2_FULL_48_7]